MTREQEFLEYVQGGGQVETGDWMPDEYRAKLDQVHRDARQLGADGRPPRARVDPARADAAAEARADGEGAGRGRPRAADLPRRRGPRQAARARASTTWSPGKAKFHNVFHYPTKTWGDVGVIAWLVDAAAIISPEGAAQVLVRAVRADHEEDLLGGVVPHPPRSRRRPHDDERHRRAARARPGGARPLVGAADALPRQPDPGRGGPDGRLADQEPGERGGAPAVPRRLRAADLGARADGARPEAAQGRDDGVWEYTEPDWDELQARRHRPRARGPRSGSTSGGSRASRRRGCAQVVLAEAA